MAALICFIIFGLFFGYFATLNTGQVAVYIGTVSLSHIPVYILVIASFAIGVIFASLFYAVKFMSTNFILKKKDQQLDAKELKAAELLKKIHQMELDNAKLKSINGVTEDDESI